MTWTRCKRAGMVMFPLGLFPLAAVALDGHIAGWPLLIMVVGILLIVTGWVGELARSDKACREPKENP